MSLLSFIGFFCPFLPILRCYGAGSNLRNSASFDNLRLYDLSDQGNKSTVPFLIIPGHHGGVISSICKLRPLIPLLLSNTYLDKDVDATCQYMISTAGNRGWEGMSTEVLLGYEIVIMP